MKLLGPMVQMSRPSAPAGQWLSAPVARQPESVRDRIGKHVASTIEGASGAGVRVNDPYRVLLPDQLMLVYLRTPDVRAAIDSIARRISSWAWTIDVELPLDDPGYGAALEQAQAADRFLRAPNGDGETWQELICKVVTDLLVYEQGAIEVVFDDLVPVPLPGVENATARIPGPDATLEELVAINGASIQALTDTYGHVLGYSQDVYGTIGPLSAGGRMGDPGASSVPYFSREQLILFRLFPNTVGRMTPLIETIVNEVITILRSSEHTMMALDADEIPPGILVLTGVAGKAAEQAKQDLQRLRGKDHRIRVITNPDPRGQGAHWVELRRTPKDLALIDVVREVRRTIWRVFGVLPVEMGASEDVPRAVGEVQLQVSTSHLVEPILDQLEAKFNARLLPLLVSEDFAGKVNLRFDREAKLSPAEQKDKAAAIVSLVREGVLTRNEARVELDQEPVAGGDVPTITTSMGLQSVASLGVPAPVLRPTVPAVRPPDVVTGDGQAAPGEVEAGEAMDEEEAAPGEVEASRPHRCGPGCYHHAPAQRVIGLPSEWPSASTFRGYRTLALRPLADAVGEYTREVEPLYDEAASECVAIVAAAYDGVMRSDDASRALDRIGQVMRKLETRWGIASQPMYERAARIARDGASNYTALPVVEDYRARGQAYQARAMAYLVAPDGLLGEVQTEMAAIIGRATGEPQPEGRARGESRDVWPGVPEALLLAAILKVWQANRYRITNWSGKLVELANQIFGEGMTEGAVGPTPQTGAGEWFVEWVAVGDDRMCSVCSAQGRSGFRPLSQLHVLPGGDTRCRANCRCVLVYWTRDEVSSGAAVSLSGAAPGNEPL
ncbi:MAG: phage portal protein [Chloroflexi bacterium]|nr:phage portal protein [Chloroflexota bacterium]